MMDYPMDYRKLCGFQNVTLTLYYYKVRINAYSICENVFLYITENQKNTKLNYRHIVHAVLFLSFYKVNRKTIWGQ